MYAYSTLDIICDKMTNHLSPVNLICLSLLTVATACGEDSRIDFSRDVRPILSEKCLKCHGPDANARQADLRLDVESGIRSERGGNSVVVAQHPDSSELIRRVESTDDDDRMPPSDANLKLSDRERRILRRWIAEGAAWEGHWSFEPVAEVVVPQTSNDGWCRNEIDHFVLPKMKLHALQPSPEADRPTLIRRLSLDLIGLPPTPEQTAAFVGDRHPDAYERLVDRLMADPRYGERMTLPWLDAARYADTDGYQNDGPRSMWRWRDWVIDALNCNMPFDQFTIEQLAGDWIPKATLDQKIATGFNRNHRYNSESGLIQEEFLLENAVDRVDTVSTVWMGITMGCARCHDHKFDSFSQREYYQLIAYFDDVSESGRAVKFGNSEPWVVAPTPSQAKQIAKLERKVAQAELRFQQAEKRMDRALETFQRNRVDPNAMKPIVSNGLTHHYLNDRHLELNGQATESLGKGPIIQCQHRNTVSFWVRPNTDDGVIIALRAKNQGISERQGLSVELVDGKLRFFIITRWIAGVGAIETSTELTTDTWTHVTLTNDGSQSARGMKVFLDGRHVQTTTLYNTNSNVSPNTQYPVHVGGDGNRASFQGSVKDLRFYNRTLREDEIDLLATDQSPIQILEIAPNDRNARQRDVLRAWFLEHHAANELKQLRLNYVSAHADHQRFYDSLPTTMVMDHQIDRPTYVRRRGVYDDHGDEVSPGTPSLLPPSNATNRLEFARWLVNGQHPLTSRVAVNRYWQQFFGRGLVDTPEDFGVQGSPPSHPELLDWLAYTFQNSDWDVKQMHRKIVSSATYRQNSASDPEQIDKDPVNRWLARAPRKRLPAHIIRDQALSVAGLLVSEVSGPSVSPYQPANLWESLSNMQYRQSKGAGLYRRSLYTIWKRTLVPPTMSILDAADRENCAVRPKRTNTPLQALTLLNETAFVEAARGLATRMLSCESDPISHGFQLVTGRQPNKLEQQLLQSALDKYHTAYRDQPENARKLLSVGDSAIDEADDPIELASYTVLANMMLNLDEVITCE